MDFNNATVIIEQHLQKQNFSKEPFGLYDPIAYTMANGGKRIRPALVLMACSIFSNDFNGAVNPALGIEILHNFTLLHDDIMDKAEIRRGKPAVHKKWNESTAILSGDAMFILAYKYVINSNPEFLSPVIKEFTKVALEICEGQQLDMDFENRHDVTISEYLEMIRLKTAVLLGSSLKIGAITGGADEKNAAYLYDFGINIGLAFQLMDDLLDVYSDGNEFGKEPGGDIASNKKTYLLLKAYELAGESEKQILDRWTSEVHFDKKQKYQAVKAVYDQLGVPELAKSLMNAYYSKALESLNMVNGQGASIGHLENLAQILMERTK